MVTIEEETVEEKETTTQGTAPTTNDEGVSSEAEGWTELMGKDLMKKTIEPSSLENPIALNHKDLVLVDFVGRAAPTPDDGSDGPIFHKATDWWVVIGDKDVVPVLEMGIRFASVGETVAVWSKSKYAYGLSTRQHDGYELPPETSVCYEIKVKQLVTNEERAAQQLKWAVTAAESKKNIGNDAYANEWSGGQGKSRIKYIYEKAARELSLAVDGISQEEIDKLGAEETEIVANAQAMLIDCLNNITAVHLRAKEYHEAKEASVKVLQRDPNNFKALIRAAKAALLDPASSYEEVDLAIAAASEKADGVQEKDLEKLRLDFQRRKQAYDKKSKSMYSKALGADNKSKQKNASSSDKDEDDNKSNNDAGAIDGAEMEQSPLPGAEEPEEKPFSWSDRSTWPWSSIYAYIFQLTLPFIMWAIAEKFRDNTPGAKPRSFFPPLNPVMNSEPDPVQHEEF